METHPATLAGIEGVGTLQIHDGDPKRCTGMFKSAADDAETIVDQVSEGNTGLIFSGTVEDGDDADTITTEVEVPDVTHTGKQIKTRMKTIGDPRAEAD